MVLVEECAAKYQVKYNEQNKKLKIKAGKQYNTLQYSQHIKINNRNENKGFRVKFVNILFHNFDHVKKTEIRARLSACGCLDKYYMVFIKDKAILFVCPHSSKMIKENKNISRSTNGEKVIFETALGRKKCIDTKKWVGIGTATVFYSQNFNANMPQFSVFVDKLAEGTSKAMIHEAFNALELFPASIHLLGDAAFVNFTEEQSFLKTLYTWFIEINRERNMIIAMKNSVLDNCKGILGFWGAGNTTHMNKLYSYIDAHLPWKILYVQPVFWDKYLQLPPITIIIFILYMFFNTVAIYLTYKAEASNTTISLVLHQWRIWREPCGHHWMWKVSCSTYTPLKEMMQAALCSPLKKHGDQKREESKTHQWIMLSLKYIRYNSRISLFNCVCSQHVPLLCKIFMVLVLMNEFYNGLRHIEGEGWRKYNKITKIGKATGECLQTFNTSNNDKQINIKNLNSIAEYKNYDKPLYYYYKVKKKKSMKNESERNIKQLEEKSQTELKVWLRILIFVMMFQEVEAKTYIIPIEMIKQLFIFLTSFFILKVIENNKGGREQPIVPIKKGENGKGKENGKIEDKKIIIPIRKRGEGEMEGKIETKENEPRKQNEKIDKQIQKTIIPIKLMKEKRKIVTDSI